MKVVIVDDFILVFLQYKNKMRSIKIHLEGLILESLFSTSFYLLSASAARRNAKNASFNGCETELVGSAKTIAW